MQQPTLVPAQPPASKPSTLSVDITPRMVSIYELLAKLMPLMEGVTWAEDALLDLWQMGAPDPSPQSRACMGKCRLKAAGRHACIPKWGCAMVKRVLLPEQFATWWADVSERQGLNISAEDALSGRFLKQPGKRGRKEHRR